MQNEHPEQKILNSPKTHPFDLSENYMQFILKEKDEIILDCLKWQSFYIVLIYVETCRRIIELEL